MPASAVRRETEPTPLLVAALPGRAPARGARLAVLTGGPRTGTDLP